MENPSLPAPDSLAAIKSRIFAGLIDLLIAVIALFLAKFILVNSGSHVLTILGIFVAVAIVLGVMVYQAVLLSSAGQTIGKKMMRIRVVAFSDGSNPGFIKAVLMRWWLPSLVYPIPYLGWTFWLADGLLVFKEDRRCLHDLMAGTKVIQLARN